MPDTHDSKSCERKLVRVELPLPAPFLFMPKRKLPDIDFKWSSELAYTVGLIATDGSLSKDGRHITFKSVDLELLETFKRTLGITNKISENKEVRKNRKKAYVIQMGSIQFYRWLLRIGLFPAKTYTLGIIAIPQKYFRDFLRGHLDGDGSIFSYKDTYNSYKGKTYMNTRVYTKFLSASEKHARWLYKMMGKHSPVQGALVWHRPKDHRVGIWEIKLAKYESLKLFRWLYYKKDLPALSRKRKIAEKLLAQIKNNKLIRVSEV